jgi:hypothetical protein
MGLPQRFSMVTRCMYRPSLMRSRWGCSSRVMREALGGLRSPPSGTTLPKKAGFKGWII